MQNEVSFWGKREEVSRTFTTIMVILTTAIIITITITAITTIQPITPTTNIHTTTMIVIMVCPVITLQTIMAVLITRITGCTRDGTMTGHMPPLTFTHITIPLVLNIPKSQLLTTPLMKVLLIIRITKTPLILKA